MSADAIAHVRLVAAGLPHCCEAGMPGKVIDWVEKSGSSNVNAAGLSPYNH